MKQEVGLINNARECSAFIILGDRRLACSLADPSQENVVYVQSPSRQGRVGLQPERFADFVSALRDRREIRLTGQSVYSGEELARCFVKITPKENGRIQIIGGDTANPPGSITLSDAQASAIAFQLERLVEIEPMKVTELRDEIHIVLHRGRRRDGSSFFTDNPTIEAEVSILLGERRFARAMNLWIDTYLRWHISHPVDVAKLASTASGRDAIGRVLAALMKP